ncbi:acetyl-CoA hydrolase/transferase C-terminal domain-containing protein [Sedimentitalea sp.]|uniref:acetyl-CoA hydrolase/transferase family protein n=1 Tax=Sedimentitalea sp. TaxID=2048915 RepID=UPI0032994BE5
MSIKRKSEKMNASEAIGLIKSGMSVSIGDMNAEPMTLSTELWRQGRELEEVTIFTGLRFTGYSFLDGEDGKAFKLKTWFIPGTVASGPKHRIRADYYPISWAQVAPFLERTPVDVTLVQVSPADANGYHSFGTSTSHSRSMLKGAKIRIAEVNKRMPRTCGDTLVHCSEFDALVEADYDIIENPFREGDKIDRAIGRKVAELIPDGTTLQFGIGTIPTQVVNELVTLKRQNLRIISQLTDAARQLIDEGCCTEENPKATVAEVLGTKDLYEWVENNPAIEMADCSVTHSARGLSAVENFVSVNSALEVDLSGQINSEIIGGQQVGGIGGSIDFVIGGQNIGCATIIAMRSCTRDGKSRIVQQFDTPIVTSPRSLTQFVVTEFGVADLRDLTLEERKKALIAISHPDHRSELAQSCS